MFMIYMLIFNLSREILEFLLQYQVTSSLRGPCMLHSTRYYFEIGNM